jgi:hypothetical protein
MTETERLLGKDAYGKWARKMLHKILDGKISKEQFDKEWNEALKSKEAEK